MGSQHRWPCWLFWQPAISILLVVIKFCSVLFCSLPRTTNVAAGFHVPCRMSHSSLQLFLDWLQKYQFEMQCRGLQLVSGRYPNQRPSVYVKLDDKLTTCGRPSCHIASSTATYSATSRSVSQLALRSCVWRQNSICHGSHRVGHGSLFLDLIQSNPQRSFHADPHPIQSIHDKVVTLHFWQFYALNKCNILVISIAHDILLKLKIQSYCPGIRPQQRSTLSVQIHWSCTQTPTQNCNGVPAKFLR